MGADASKSVDEPNSNEEAGPTPEAEDVYDKVFRGELDPKAAFRAAFETDSSSGLNADALDAIVAELEGRVGDKSEIFKDVQMLEEMARQQEAKQRKVHASQTKRAESQADGWMERQLREGAAAAVEAERLRQDRQEAAAMEEARRQERMEAKKEAFARARLFEQAEVALRQAHLEELPQLGIFCFSGSARSMQPEALDVLDDLPSPPKLASGPPVPELYKVLGVTVDATFEEIKKAYRKQALYWHPDKNRQRLEEATTRFQKINEAFDTLFDPERRSSYDAGNVREPGKAKKLTGSGWAEIPDEDDLALTPIGIRFKKTSWRSYVASYGRIDDDPEQIIEDDRDPRAPAEKIRIFWRFIGEMAYKERDESDVDDWVKQFILKVWKDTPSRWPKALELQQMNEAAQQEWKDRRTVFNRRKQKVLLHLEMHENYLAIPDVMQKEQARLIKIFASQSISGKRSSLLDSVGIVA